MPLTGRASRWTFALLLMLGAALLNIWIHAMTAGRVPFLPFYPVIIAIGFVSGAIPGAVALLFAEAFVVYFWLLPASTVRTLQGASAGWASFAFAAGLGLALAALARSLLLQSRQTRDQLDAALRAAREVEQRFAIALKGGYVNAWACDADKRYTWVYNPAAGESQPPIGRRVEEIMPRQCYPTYAEALDRVFATGRGERLTVNLNQGGEPRRHLAHIDPVLDAAGHVIGLVGASMDTTELQRAQDAVQHREAQLRTISDALPVLISYVDQDLCYRFNNAAYEHWYHRSRTEITNRPVREVIGDTAFDAVLPHLRRGLNGESVHFETRVHFPCGLRHVAVTYIPQRVGRAISGVVVLAEDISERIRSELVLQHKERRWRTMFDAQPECIAVLAPDGALTDMNPAGLAMIEAGSVEQLRAHSIHSLIEPTQLASFRAMHEAALADKPFDAPREFELIGLKGTRRTMESRSVPLHDETGEVVAVLSVMQDVSERKRAERALREADRRKDEFLATLAHELRNPMAPIRYAAASLRDSQDATVRHAREVIERQAAQMSHLLDDLLDMSRVTRNVIELQRARIDLRELLSEATATAQPLLTNLQHRLTVSIPPNPLWVNGDGTRLLQVIGNLIDNAAKYTPPGGGIEVRLESDGQSALLQVKDNGIGLSADMIPRVFELFTQVHKSGRLSPGGLGIGLAVVKRLVELHEGSISASSAGLGEGAQFSVRLPLADPAHAAAPEQAEPVNVVPLFRGRFHVLVVDDNRDAAESLSEILRAEGFLVTKAFDGAGALASFDRTQPAVVLLDMGLPDMHGTAVAREMRARALPHPLHVIAVTGWGQEEDRARTRAAGVDLHLVKPVDPADLLRLLDQRLRNEADESEQSQAG